MVEIFFPPRRHLFDYLYILDISNRGVITTVCFSGRMISRPFFMGGGKGVSDVGERILNAVTLDSLIILHHIKYISDVVDTASAHASYHHPAGCLRSNVVMVFLFHRPHRGSWPKDGVTILENQAFFFLPGRHMPHFSRDIPGSQDTTSLGRRVLP